MGRAYSFLDTQATLAGPGGVINLAAGAAVAQEGITIEPEQDKNRMQIGADGQGQHSLIASDAAKVTVRLLKTSPVNAQLGVMYDLQSSSSALWGQNVMNINNSGLGDVSVGQGIAFRKKPVINYAEEAGFMDWEFDVISLNTVFGI